MYYEIEMQSMHHAVMGTVCGCGEWKHDSTYLGAREMEMHSMQHR